MLFDEFVYAKSVSLDNPPCFRFEQCRIAVRSAAQAKRAKFFVPLQRYGPKNLRKLASSDAPQQIHLPQPVLSHNVALRFGEILDRCGANVRHAPAIAVDNNFLLKPGKGNAAVELWQGAVNEPPYDHASGNDDHDESPEENSENDSQCHSRVI